MKRIPASAYADYLRMGPKRSYRALAARYGVSKTAIFKRAQKEHWQERVAELVRQASERAEQKAVDKMEAVRERHLAEVRVLQAHALQALRDLPPEKGFRAASVLAIAWKHELMLLGAPDGQQATAQKNGVLVAPAEMTPTEWIRQAEEHNKHAVEPGIDGDT